MIRTGPAEASSAGPVLVTVDNVQWADLATTQALRSMPRLLASYPLSWILAMGTSADAGQAGLLFDLLENDGAARIALGPLDLAAQVALVGDVLGAIPDQGLIELAADAAGNPLILAEAFRGRTAWPSGMSSSGRRSRRCSPNPSSRPCTGSSGRCCWPAAVPRFPRRTTCSGGPSR